MTEPPAPVPPTLPAQPAVVAEGPRLRLERLGVARARALLAGDYSGVDPAPGWPHEDTMDGVRVEAEHAQSDEQTGFLAIRHDTGQVIGEAGWKGGPDAEGVAEIGYGIAAPSRGQGLGTELVGLITGWVVAQPEVRSVVAGALAGNLPSRRALERNGFVLTREEPPDVWYALAVPPAP
jgi:ribosomal-protein-alanine N-acetyltransferase